MFSRRATRDMALSTKISLAEHLRSEREFHSRIEASLLAQNDERRLFQKENREALAGLRGDIKEDVTALHERVTGVIWRIVEIAGGVLTIAAAVILYLTLGKPH